VSEDLESALRLPPGPARTAALAAWFQGLFDEGEREQIPVLVGGSAVELYSGGAYTTGDLDFVGSLSRRVERELIRSGFERAGRHWVHDEGQVFIETPATALTEGEEVVRVEFGAHSVLTISPEDALLDRLAAWIHWESGADGVAAFLLYRTTRTGLDEDRLRRLAEERGLPDALERLVGFDRRTGGREPTPEEMETWASGMER
jgi:hypothetical protein